MKRQFLEVAKTLPCLPLVIANAPLVGLKWHLAATSVSIFSNTQLTQISRIAP